MIAPDRRDLLSAFEALRALPVPVAPRTASTAAWDYADELFYADSWYAGHVDSLATLGRFAPQFHSAAADRLLACNSDLELAATRLAGCDDPAEAAFGRECQDYLRELKAIVNRCRAFVELEPV